MKYILILIALSSLLCQSPVIAQDTSFYNSAWKETTAANATYFRLKAKTDSGWRVTDCFYRSGKIQMTGLYTDDSLKISQGVFTWYDDHGVISRRCNYLQGKADGEDSYYYSNGRPKVEGKEREGHYDGEWVSYYPSGRPAGKAVFENGAEVSCSFLNEDGSRNKSVTAFTKTSEYPGGVAKFGRYLNKNLKYPDIALKNKIEGTVVVTFKVTKEGDVTEVKVYESSNKSLDEEALRVIRMTGAWQPAVFGGFPIDSYKKQPIIFHL